MIDLVTGNAADHAARRGWFVGDLASWLGGGDAAAVAAADSAHGPRQSDRVEVKWGVHPAGEERAGGWSMTAATTTLSVLVSGTFELEFRDAPAVEGSSGAGAPARRATLARPGDYAVWRDASLVHRWRATTDAVVMTVRWREGA